MNRRSWFVAGAAFGVGLLVGFVAGSEAVEAKKRKEYEESSAFRKHAMDLVNDPNTKIDGVLWSAPLPENDPNEFVFKKERVLEDPEIVLIPTIHPPVVTEEEKVQMGSVVSLYGGERPEGFCYLEPEDYEMEDGNDKLQIVIFMDGDEPQFMMDGQVIEDWPDRIGQSILRDFYAMVGPGEPQVIYVRNFATNEDYEVIREVP